jgi:hypothetical protein
MYPRRLVRTCVAVVAAALLWAPSGLAASHARVVADCNAHGQLTAQYTLGQLREALSTIPPAIKEYTNCYDVIQRQLLAQLGQSKQDGGGSGGGGGGSFLPVPVIVVLAVLVVIAGGYSVVAIRRREGGGGPPASG